MRLKQIGCIACFLSGAPNRPAEIHHLNLGGRAGQKRRGDEFTIPLCRWHHQGDELIGNATPIGMAILLGPSLKLESRKFRAKYGRDDVLLAKVNDLIRQMDELAGFWRKPPSDPIAAEIERLDAVSAKADALVWPDPLTEAQRSIE